ncbi:DUF4362 domain-containing protein [Paenibacillus segetis]|uniref:DUF4362 domain-containing protein n=1 Tax=Paenibacillus segetis TaxID=1325360 RepID=A0ABQ1YIM0_9BACL|nr:DUF4362 domain-containing protein [Paenibacillus segetis]GGH27290.1 hypothetical protein GCM10008013_28640 [Paenibacillus segetis]
MKHGMKYILLIIVSLVLFSCSNSIGKESGSKGYDADKAIQRGDVVDQHGRISNAERLDSFILSIDEKKVDKIRITRYTIEGDPIFFDFKYDGKVITYKYDNSNDKFGSSNVRSTVCKNFTKNTEGTTTEYKIEACTGANAEIGDNFSFEIDQ